jgi:hypothetical protein
VIFNTHGCADGHGTHDVGSAALAAAFVGSGSNFAPALLPISEGFARSHSVTSERQGIFVKIA